MTRRGKALVVKPRHVGKQVLIDFLVAAIRAHGLEPVFEYQFDVNRRWRFDLAILSGKVAIELQGGTFSGGRHTRGRGYENDCKKTLAAAADGWLVLPITYTMLEEDLTEILAAVDHVLESRRTLTSVARTDVG